MAMSHMTSHYNRVQAEDADFPILCEVCLGNNPYLRMQKDTHGEECKICSRPFTTFRWCPGRGCRYKKTEICQTCAKLKNVCQTCLLDLEYGLPVQVRDAALQKKDELPKQKVNRDFYIQNVEKQMAEHGTQAVPIGGGEIESNAMLSRLARRTPYYRRNLPHICSFWVKGECRRGEECPYRHEKPSDPDDPLSDQNMKDRYYGVNDPVANKILDRVKEMPSITPPEDKTITTLYIGNLGTPEDEDYAGIGERDLHNFFYQYGEIRHINIVPNRGCAFLQYTTRDSAERAAERSFNRVIINNRKLSVRWGRPHTAAGSSYAGDEQAMLAPVPGLPGALPLPLAAPSGPDFFGLTNEGNDDADGEEPAEKRPRAAVPPPHHIPMPRAPIFPRGGPRPPMPGPTWFGPGHPRFRAPLPGAPPQRPGAPIYYPSMDPQHLGAKELHD